MMKLKRIAAAILVAVMCVMPLTGCHGSRDRATFEIPASFNESKKIELTFWAKNDTNKAQTEIYQRAIDEFTEIYPNVDITLRLYTDYGKIYNDVITNIPTNTTPNVCITYPDHIATYMTGENTVVPLDDLINDSRYGLGGSQVRFDSPKKDEMIQKYMQECVLSGQHYAIPYMRSSEACYINKTYVEKLGYTLPDKLTWEFIWEVSDKAAEKNDDGTFRVNGQKVMIPFIYKSTDNMMIQMLRQLDAGYSDVNGRISLFNDTTKDILYQVSDHVKKGAFSTFKISSYPANFLNAGQCIFAIDSTAGATWMGGRAPHSDISADSIVDFETAVMPIPQYDVNSPKMISQGPSLCIFNKNDPDVVIASWLFTQYLVTNSIQIAYAQTEGYIPVTSKAHNDPVYIDYLNNPDESDEKQYAVKIAATKMLLDNIQNTFVTPVFNGSASLRDAAGHLIESVAKSTRRKETVDEAYMEKLFADTGALYRLDSVTSSGGKAELGELPATAAALIASLITVWVLIILYLILRVVSKKMKEHPKREKEEKLF